MEETTQLPPAQEVIDLFNLYIIQRIRIYDPDPAPLQAGGGSSIELVLGVPEVDIPNLASSQDNADAWVQNNVIRYTNVRFRYIPVGN